MSGLKEPIDHVDYGFGLDTPTSLTIGRLVDISDSENLYDYSGTRKLVQSIIIAEPFMKYIKEHVYNDNLVAQGLLMKDIHTATLSALDNRLKTE